MEEVRKLSDDDKIKALATFNGYTGIEMHYGTLQGEPLDYLIGYVLPSSSPCRIPNYLNSLDEIFKLEERLTKAQKAKYFSVLCALMATKPTDEPTYLYHIKPEVKIMALLATILP